MLTHYIVLLCKGMKQIRLTQILKQSPGFQVKEASDVINHVLLAKQIKLQIQYFDVRRFVFFLYTHRSLCVEHHITRNKDAVMFTNVTANTFQGQINTGFSKVCEIFKVHGIESLKYIREFHTPVCYCVNETNCDWLFNMSIKRPHGRALANECGHLFQTFGCQSEGLATRD